MSSTESITFWGFVKVVVITNVATRVIDFIISFLRDNPELLNFWWVIPLVVVVNEVTKYPKNDNQPTPAPRPA